MSLNLEDELLRAIRNGLLNVSLNKDWDGPNWTAGYRNTDNGTIRTVKNADPIEALRLALRRGIKDADLPASRAKTKPAAAPAKRRGADLI